jgi:hypothetical protein
MDGKLTERLGTNSRKTKKKKKVQFFSKYAEKLIILFYIYPYIFVLHGVYYISV